MSENIIVTGATGHLGTQVIKFLLERLPSSSISAFARSADKARDLEALGVKVRLGSYDDYPSMLAAFSAVDKLYLVPSSEFGKRLLQQTSAVNAAREAGVRQIFFVSFQRTNEGPDSPMAGIANDYIATEAAIKQSGLAFTILKHPLYMEALLNLCGAALKTGTLYTPAGEGRVSYAARVDLAEAAAVVLTTYGHESETYEFSGPLSYSYPEIATILGEVCNKHITYVSPSVEQFLQTQAKAGIPVEASRYGVIFADAIRQGEFDHPDTTLEEFLGHPAIGPREFLTTALGM